MAKSKRQMTAAKRAREQGLREKRLRKQEKKQAAADLRAQGGIPEWLQPTEDDNEQAEEDEA